VLRLALRHVPAPDRAKRVEHIHQLLARREIDPDGLLVAADNGRLVGALICTLLPGASSHLWPPHTLHTAEKVRIEDALISTGLDWLRRGGAKLAQAILSAVENAYAGALPRNGLRHVTRLLSLRHALREIPSVTPPNGLTVAAFRTNRPEVFHQTLQRTYEGTLDCPELNGVREVEEVVQGHMSQGRFHPDRWWLIRLGKRPVGVLLLNEIPEWKEWEVAYVGVVPEVRRSGIGRTIAWQALTAAKSAGQRALNLAVDQRNLPARQLYHALGFESLDHREVYLHIFGEVPRGRE
jgi:ribosomal protein S18 acetylase RimI-like enzyme